MALEAADGTAFQITAGPSDTDGLRRQLVFGVPETNDSVRLDWPAGADFEAGPVEVLLRIGTMPAQRVTVKDNAIIDATPPAPPRFGPDADGVVSALAHAYATLAVAHPAALAVLHGKVPKHFSSAGKVPKDLLADDADDLATTVAEHAAAGAAIGATIAGPEGAVTGAILGAAIGAMIHMTE